ncbi:MAG: delta-60 repeat domain-containing protein [Chloroflexota bacterium]
MKNSYKSRSVRMLGAVAAILPLLLTAACNQTADVPVSQSTSALLLSQPTSTARPSATKTPSTQAALTGKLDNSFDVDGRTTTDVGSTNDEARDVVVQPDGKIVVMGETWTGPYNRPRFALTRYKPNGKLDQSFGDGGMIIENISGSEYDTGNPCALLLQPDGKLLIAGTTLDPVLHQWVFALLRYNADGTLDAKFGDRGKTLTPIDQKQYSQSEDEIHSIALAPDGKIVAAGITGRYPHNFAATRYNKDGSLDETFGNEGRVITAFPSDANARAVAVQPDGKVVVAGYASLEGGKEHQDYTMVRYNIDGSLDEAFGDQGIVMTDFANKQDWAYSMVLRPDGKIVLAGPVEIDARLCGAYICSVFGYGFAQYNTDGSLDDDFGDSGTISYKYGGSDGNYDLLRLPDGKLLAAGHVSNNDFGLALLNEDGTPVKSFGTKGWATASFGPYTDRANAIAMQPDGKIVAVGSGVVDKKDILNDDFAIARFK